MIDTNYLNELIAKCNEMKSDIKFKELNDQDYGISYLPTKKTFFVGYKKGFSEQYDFQKYGLKENAKIRANCKNYLKIYRDEEGKIVQIQEYHDGRTDCIHQAHFETNTIYFFPFSTSGYPYPTYIYVTKYDGDWIAEESMVTGNSIIYEKYEKKDDVVSYENIHWVPNGKYPVLSRESGIFSFDPFAYQMLDCYSWLDDFRKSDS